MTTKTEYTFPSSNPGTMVSVKVWAPDDPSNVRAVVQIAHGMAEYINRYDEFARFLADRGVLVVGNDHIGHGDSVPSQSAWGFFGKHQPANLLVSDMRRLFHNTSEEYPGLPYFVFGHSMGSFLTREYISLYGHELEGAIVCGTGAMSPVEIAGGRMVVAVMKLFKGEQYRSPFITTLMFGTYNARIENPRTTYDWLTKDEAIVDDYISNPATGFTFTLNAYGHMLKNIAYVHKMAAIERVPKTLPVRFIGGAMDPVGGYGKGVPKTAARFVEAGISDVTFRLFEGDRHEIINEIDRDVVYADVLSWIEEHLA